MFPMLPLMLGKDGAGILVEFDSQKPPGLLCQDLYAVFLDLKSLQC